VWAVKSSACGECDVGWLENDKRLAGNFAVRLSARVAEKCEINLHEQRPNLPTNMQRGQLDSWYRSLSPESRPGECVGTGIPYPYLHQNDAKGTSLPCWRL
jgi:hypothetical protein